MGLKNFIKPSWKKIILFVILFSIVFFIPYIKVDDTLHQSLLKAGHYSIILFFLMSLGAFMDLFNGNFYISEFIPFLLFVFLFFVIYLFSCLIIHLYNRKITKNNL